MSGVYKWSKTAALNASADPTVNWQEGQAPSSINDSARAMMTSISNFRDDISGAILTTGTSAAYIVASNQVFDTLADFAGQVIAFTPHVTNAAGPVTITVDGFTNLPLRTAPGKELMAGVLIQGTPYTATYNNTDGALYLQGIFGNPFNVPLFGGMDFWDTIAPNSSFIFPMGQAINRTTYATAFARWGTKFGAGDGSTTFNVPNKAGKVSAMTEAVATLLTNTFFGADSTQIGSVGGSQNDTLLTANLPPIPYTPAGTIAGTTNILEGGVSGAGVAGPFFEPGGTSGNANLPLIGTFTGTPASLGGTSTPIRTVQPTITCNYIIRIL